eukprot:2139866-Rhodomonas_salina.1
MPAQYRTAHSTRVAGQQHTLCQYRTARREIADGTRAVPCAAGSSIAHLSTAHRGAPRTMLAHSA